MQENTKLSIKDGIRSSYLVNGLSEDEIAAIERIAKDLTFQPNEEVVRREFKDADLFIVVEGKVLINASNGDFIARIKPGSVFGEIALIDERPRSASVICETTTRLAMIPAQDLRQLMDSNPEMAVKILYNLGKILCERLRSANLQIEALLTAL